MKWKFKIITAFYGCDFELMPWNSNLKLKKANDAKCECEGEYAANSIQLEYWLCEVRTCGAQFDENNWAGPHTANNSLRIHLTAMQLPSFYAHLFVAGHATE